MGCLESREGHAAETSAAKEATKAMLGNAVADTGEGQIKAANQAKEVQKEKPSGEQGRGSTGETSDMNLPSENGAAMNTGATGDTATEQKQPDRQNSGSGSPLQKPKQGSQGSLKQQESLKQQGSENTESTEGTSHSSTSRGKRGKKGKGKGQQQR
eukprot:GEMP01052761.1.p1 GENE.GEMP01052761.1~~GEMP01052761.1.p1  ORF type:complete len:156 (+),score=41.49 GEMP01052761.1:134-601(+)